MSDGKTSFGILLPHFGEHASWDRILKGARQAERYGFDSVWVRDHLVFHPHGMEGTDRTFFEPFSVLTAIAASTERIVLGTGSIIPHRHPIYGAQVVASLSRLAGADRVIVGYGAGNFDHEFDAIGLAGVKRTELLREQVEIFRKLWSGDDVDHEGQHYAFREVGLRPTPASQVQVWYCGGTPASTRLAVEFCDGWMPGRITFDTYRTRVGSIRRQVEKTGRAMPALAAIPITSPGRSLEDAVGKVNLGGLLKNANTQRFWEKPASGEFRTAEELAGSFIYGSSADIAEQVRTYQEIGMDHLVFDLRFRFAEFEDCLGQLGEEVLPLLRGAPTPAARA